MAKYAGMKKKGPLGRLQGGGATKKYFDSAEYAGGKKTGTEIPSAQVLRVQQESRKPKSSLGDINVDPDAAKGDAPKDAAPKETPASE